MNKKPLDNNYSAIAAYLISGGTTNLTELQETLLARWTTAHEWMLQRWLDQEIALALHTRFNVNLVTAYRDIDRAKKLFGEAQPMNVRYRLKLMWDWILEDLKKARDSGDLKTAASLYKQMILVVRESKEYDHELEGLLGEKIIEITALPEHVGLESVSMERIEQILKDFESRRKPGSTGQ